MNLVDNGMARAGKTIPETGRCTAWYLGRVARNKIDSGEYTVTGRDRQGAVVVEVTDPTINQYPAKTIWNRQRHHAGWHGTNLLNQMLTDRKFPFPKSLYAVEDSLRLVTKDKPNATVLDFFSGSGTTAHAVMRLNKQDGGKRRSISVTNNEVSFEEAKKLTKEGYRPGDPEWERLGICDYVTKPRIEAAITGKTPDGDPIKGDYKFTDEFPMADGFEANARFFTLTYEPPTRVRHGLAYKQIAPLLWMKAGQFGRVIESIPDRGWDVAESHGVIKNLAAVESFADAIRETGSITTAYIVTDDDLAFQSTVSRLDGFDVKCVQLYNTYLTNFAFTQSGGAI
ncbi:DNA methyltransferase [Corynebacterium mayonis]|uniref:DNA methyltransferase n=1 Tax=Corynebacterium mayonis TaxID=3062461 RepID=UPI003140A32C